MCSCAHPPTAGLDYALMTDGMDGRANMVRRRITCNNIWWWQNEMSLHKYEVVRKHFSVYTFMALKIFLVTSRAIFVSSALPAPSIPAICYIAERLSAKVVCSQSRKKRPIRGIISFGRIFLIEKLRDTEWLIIKRLNKTLALRNVRGLRVARQFRWNEKISGFIWPLMRTF